MRAYVLTLVLMAVKPAIRGQPPEDSATCEWDTDRQEAGVLEID